MITDAGGNMDIKLMLENQVVMMRFLAAVHQDQASIRELLTCAFAFATAIATAHACANANEVAAAFAPASADASAHASDFAIAPANAIAPRQRHRFLSTPTQET